MYILENHHDKSWRGRASNPCHRTGLHLTAGPWTTRSKLSNVSCHYCLHIMAHVVSRDSDKCQVQVHFITLRYTSLSRKWHGRSTLLIRVVETHISRVYVYWLCALGESLWFCARHVATTHALHLSVFFARKLPYFRGRSALLFCEIEFLTPGVSWLAQLPTI